MHSKNSLPLYRYRATFEHGSTPSPPSAAAKRAARSSKDRHERRVLPCTSAVVVPHRVAHRLEHRRHVPVGHRPSRVDSGREPTLAVVATRGGQQRIPRPESARPGAPPPWAHLSAAARRFSLADVRRRLRRPPRPPSRRRATRRPARRGAGADLRDGRRGPRRAHQTARDDAVPPGRDRLPGRQARARRRPVPPGRGPARGARGDRPRPRHGRDRGRARHAHHRRGPVRAHPLRRAARRAAAPASPTRPRWCGSSTSPLSELLADDVYREERWDIPPTYGVAAGRQRPIHFFELADETVWGATARILADFLAHLTADR